MSKPNLNLTLDGSGAGLDGNSIPVASLVRGTDGQVVIGQTGAAAAWTAVSGDATLSAAGAVTLSEATRAVTAKVSITNAQLKALRATPKTLVAAQAGKVLQFMGAILELKAGANVLTESADNMAVKYENGAGAAVSDTIESTGFIDQAANTITSAVPVKDAIVVASSAINKPLVLHNTGDGEFGGNAANDATVDVFVTYRVLTIAA